MTFQVGDSETARKGGLARVANQRKLIDFLTNKLDETGVLVFEKLARVAESGEDLTESQKFAIKEIREWAPFAHAKKTENKTALTDGEGKPLAAPVINVVVSSPAQNADNA